MTEKEQAEQAAVPSPAGLIPLSFYKNRDYPRPKDDDGSIRPATTARCGRAGQGR